MEEPHRRDAHALAEHVARRHVEGAGHRTAEIRPVAVRLREADQMILIEDRADKAHVGEVRAAGIRIVDGIDIARQHLALEGADHVLAGEMQRADMHRDILVPLRDGIAVAVMQAVGKVAVVDHEGIAGAQHLLGHLVDRGDEGVLQNLEGHGVEAAADIHHLVHGVQPFVEMRMFM